MNSHQNPLWILNLPSIIRIATFSSEFIHELSLKCFIILSWFGVFKDCHLNILRILTKVLLRFSSESFQDSHRNHFEILINILPVLLSKTFQDSYFSRELISNLLGFSSESFQDALRLPSMVPIRILPGLSSGSFQYSHQNPSRLKVQNPSSHQSPSIIIIRILSRLSPKSFKYSHKNTSRIQTKILPKFSSVIKIFIMTLPGI